MAVFLGTKCPLLHANILLKGCLSHERARAHGDRAMFTLIHNRQFSSLSSVTSPNPLAGKLAKNPRSQLILDALRSGRVEANLSRRRRRPCQRRKSGECERALRQQTGPRARGRGEKKLQFSARDREKHWNAEKTSLNANSHAKASFYSTLESDERVKASPCACARAICEKLCSLASIFQTLLLLCHILCNGPWKIVGQREIYRRGA